MYEENPIMRFKGKFNIKISQSQIYKPQYLFHIRRFFNFLLLIIGIAG